MVIVDGDGVLKEKIGEKNFNELMMQIESLLKTMSLVMGKPRTFQIFLNTETDLNGYLFNVLSGKDGIFVEVWEL